MQSNLTLLSLHVMVTKILTVTVQMADLVEHAVCKVRILLMKLRQCGKLCRGESRPLVIVSLPPAHPPAGGV